MGVILLTLMTYRARTDCSGLSTADGNIAWSGDSFHELGAVGFGHRSILPGEYMQCGGGYSLFMCSSEYTPPDSGIVGVSTSQWNISGESTN